MDLHELIKSYEPQMINMLEKLISVPSVKSEAVGNKPYGEKCAEVLKLMLEIAGSYGFRTVNHENYIGEITYPNNKPTKLGILCHLDVVPASGKDGWTPFKAVVDSEKIVGRGAIDDKGPAVSVLFALKAVKELGIELDRNVKFIVGCDEENGSSDIVYYKKNVGAMPENVFTPDGNFPVINIEKGMQRVKFEKKLRLENIVSFKGGEVVNAVPSNAVAVIKGVSGLHESDGITFSATEDGWEIRCKGTPAHASTPDGDNAITKLVEYLRKLELSEADRTFLNSLINVFPHNQTDGLALGIKTCDEKSGALTCVFSLAAVENNFFSGMADIRFPVSSTEDEIFQGFSSALKDFDTTLIMSCPPHCTDENSEFVRKLIASYEKVTGLKGYCQAIGGGTYVHDIEGGVAFGAEYPDENCLMHSKGEFITRKNLLLNAEIFADAIISVCKD